MKKIPKDKFGPQPYENDFLPGWAVSKAHHSAAARKRFEDTIAAKKKMLAERAKRMMASRSGA